MELWDHWTLDGIVDWTFNQIKSTKIKNKNRFGHSAIVANTLVSQGRQRQDFFLFFRPFSFKSFLSFFLLLEWWLVNRFSWFDMFSQFASSIASRFAGSNPVVESVAAVNLEANISSISSEPRQPCYIARVPLNDILWFCVVSVFLEVKDVAIMERAFTNQAFYKFQDDHGNRQGLFMNVNWDTFERPVRISSKSQVEWLKMRNIRLYNVQCVNLRLKLKLITLFHVDINDVIFFNAVVIVMTRSSSSCRQVTTCSSAWTCPCVITRISMPRHWGDTFLDEMMIFKW